MSQTKGRGRPPGAKNIKEYADVVPSRCKKCGSSRRSPYHNARYDDHTGEGLPFVGIHYRPCKCLDCGQARIDKEPVYEASSQDAIASTAKDASKNTAIVAGTLTPLVESHSLPRRIVHK
jgi:hypothetical protein